jgi:hypothetical protein
MFENIHWVEEENVGEVKVCLGQWKKVVAP